MLSLYYANEGYVKFKDIIGFSFSNALAVNKKGVVIRYFKCNDINVFYKKLICVAKKGEEKKIIDKAYNLDKKLKLIIKKYNSKYNIFTLRSLPQSTS